MHRRIEADALARGPALKSQGEVAAGHCRQGHFVVLGRNQPQLAFAQHDAEIARSGPVMPGIAGPLWRVGKLAQTDIALIGEPLAAIKRLHHFALVAPEAQVKEREPGMTYEEGVRAPRLQDYLLAAVGERQL